jgi:hypothetical protein
MQPDRIVRRDAHSFSWPIRSQVEPLAAVTVTFTLTFFFPLCIVITAVPGSLPLKTPVFDTVTTCFLFDVNFTFCVDVTGFSSGVSAAVSPTFMTMVFDATLTDFV